MPDSTAFPVRSAGIGAVPDTVAGKPIATGVRVRPADRANTGVWSRVLVLLGVLVVLKLVLIAGQGKSLYEAHWRIGGVDVTWLNYAGFYGFVLLGGLSLVRLGSEWRAHGLRSIRIGLGAVLALGLSFIFLTFHNGEKNYLYPILTGTLKWDSLGPYLANSLFFDPPFLAAWLFVYAAVYYVLGRTGREHWMVPITAAAACAYAVVNLEDLLLNGDELLIIDCLGVLALLATGRWNWRAKPAKAPQSFRASGWTVGTFSVAWLLVPLSWVAFFSWALLRFDGQWRSNPAHYFLGLIGVTFALFTGATFLVRKLGRSQLWSWLLPFLCIGFLLLTDLNYSSSGNYQHLLCLALTFPRYVAGDLVLLALLGGGGLLYRRVWPQARLWWLDVAGLALILIAGIDLRLSQIMGVRLGWDLLSFGDSPVMMLRLAKPYLPGLVVGLTVVGLIYALAVRTIARLWDNPRRFATESTAPKQANPDRFFRFSGAAIYVAAIFVGLAFLGAATAEPDKVQGQPVLRLVQTSPWWKRVAQRTMGRDEFLKTAASLGLGDFTQLHSPTPVEAQKDLNVLVVFMESSYNKHLSLFGSSEETQPVLSKYKDRMELFPNFFSAFAGSIHARFATFTSLYPIRDFHAFTQERVPVKSLFEVLHDRGYTCSLFYSSYFDYTGFRDFLKNRALDEMYDADTMPGQRSTERVEWGLLEEETLGAIRRQLQKYADKQQRFCLTYVPAAPHYPYDRIPKAFQKHKMVELGDFAPVYLNELMYMDWVIGAILDQLKELGLLEHTLVVITNDHGEMLGGKDGHIGHGWAITPELANTPLILMDPQRPGFHINPTIGTQVDLLPTILCRLNIPVPAGQLYEGLSLDAGSSRAGRVGYLSSYKQFGIVLGTEVLLGDREGGGPNGLPGPAAFSIGNEGAKTLFTGATEPDPLPERKKTMARFDAFQENLLRNYAFYCESIRGGAQQQAKK